MTTFIEPYNPNWKIAFERIKQVIEAALTDLKQQFDIQHIGSTSVEGLYAKPILDIDIIIENKGLLKEIASRLVKIGYKAKGEQRISGRFAFSQSSDLVPWTAERKQQQAHHLYICYADSLALKNHILFRDTLKKDKELREQYAELKKRLTDNLQITMEEYCIRKTDFIVSVLAAAGLDEKELEEIANANT